MSKARAQRALLELNKRTPATKAAIQHLGDDPELAEVRGLLEQGEPQINEAKTVLEEFLKGDFTPRKVKGEMVHGTIFI